MNISDFKRGDKAFLINERTKKTWEVYVISAGTKNVKCDTKRDATPDQCGYSFKAPGSGIEKSYYLIGTMQDEKLFKSKETWEEYCKYCELKAFLRNKATWPHIDDISYEQLCAIAEILNSSTLPDEYVLEGKNLDSGNSEIVGVFSSLDKAKEAAHNITRSHAALKIFQCPKNAIHANNEKALVWEYGDVT